VNSSVQPAADGQPVTASLMMRRTSSEEEVLDFYADALGDADFSPVGEPSSDADVTSQTFHADEANQMLAVSIAPDTEDEDALLVTVGGRVLPRPDRRRAARRAAASPPARTCSPAWTRCSSPSSTARRSRCGASHPWRTGSSTPCAPSSREGSGC